MIAVHLQLLANELSQTRCKGTVLPVFHRFLVPRLQCRARLVQRSDFLFLPLSPAHTMGPPLCLAGTVSPCEVTPGEYLASLALGEHTACRPAQQLHKILLRILSPGWEVGQGNSPPLNMLPAHGLPGSAGTPDGSGTDKAAEEPAWHILTFSDMSGS